MTTRSTREALQVQLIDTQRILKMVNGHAIMSRSLRYKEQEIKQQLDALPLDQKEARVILFFSGKPVSGSLGIDANFVGRILSPFQNMVNADFAQRINGKVGGRGPLNNKEESQLFITALPRGSFGIELSKLNNLSSFDETQLADSLVHISNLVEAAAKSDEDFAVTLDETATRTVGKLKEFLKVVSEEEAGVTIESGGTRCDLTPEAARIAFNRVNEAKTDESEITIEGTLKGILLESWRFDFVSNDHTVITGRIDNELSEEAVSEFIKSFFNSRCTASFQIAKVAFKNGKEKIAYKLLNINPPR